MQQLPLFEGSPLPFTARPSRPAVRSKHPMDRYSVERNEWQTPQPIIDHAVSALGAIDLDPCSSSKNDLNIPARRRLTPDDNSLQQAWQGRVWLIPPYGRAIGHWINKLCIEYEHGDVTAAMLLVPVRPEAAWWSRLVEYPFCALRGKVKFIRVRDGKKITPPYGSAAVYLGPQLSRFATAFADLGTIYIPYNQG